MNTQPIDRRDHGTPVKAKTPAAKRAVGAPGIRGQRLTVCRFDYAGGAQRQRVTRVPSIEELIARAVAENPPQLYRGGA